MSSNDHENLGLNDGFELQEGQGMDEIDEAMGIFGSPDNGEELAFDSAFDAMLGGPTEEAEDAEKAAAEQPSQEGDSRLGGAASRMGDRFGGRMQSGRFGAVNTRAAASPRIYGAVSPPAVPPSPPAVPVSPATAPNVGARSPIIASASRGMGRGRVVAPKPREEDNQARELERAQEDEALQHEGVSLAPLFEESAPPEAPASAPASEHVDLAEDSSLGLIEVEHGDLHVEEQEARQSEDHSDVSDVSDVSSDVSDVSSDVSDVSEVSDVEVAVEEPEQVSVEAASELIAEQQVHHSQAKPVLDVQQKPEILDIPESLAAMKYLKDHGEYRAESRRLLRTQDWAALSAMMDNSLIYATWAALPEVRSSMLKDLARLYGEQLANPNLEEETYSKLLQEDATDREALQYMVERLEQRSDYAKIHTLYRRAVDNSWDNAERIRYTQDAVDLADKQMHKPSLVIEDWEHLWEMGEHTQEVEAKLLASYRAYGHWQALAEFIEKRCQEWGNMERLGWREIIQIFISGLKDAAQAQGPLDRLLAERALDPLLLLQSINVSSLSGDIDKLAQLSRISGLPSNVSHDILRAAADVLWEKGERELSVQAYDTLLDSLPDDRDALQAKENYFLESGNYEALCIFYEGRADKALNEGDTEEVLQYLEKAASVAEEKLADTERAISLWKRVIREYPENAAAYEKVVSLYDSVDDVDGVSQALEGLLAISFRPAVRKEILARLGNLYFTRLEQYDKAEACWLKVMAIDPMNPTVSEELSKIYAKRGDYSALDQSLTQQIRTARSEDVLSLAISKAKYLEEDSPLSAHTSAAWEIVLDYAPKERQALDALAACADALKRPNVMMAAWEQAFINEENLSERISLGLRIAKARQDHSSHVSSLAAYLRVLRMDPCNGIALSAMQDLCSSKDHGLLRAVLEQAVLFEADHTKKIALLKQVLKAIPEDAVPKRMAVLRRLIAFGDKDSFAALADLARKHTKFESLAASYMRAAYEADNEDDAHAALHAWAKINEEDLNNPNSAFMLVLSCALNSDKLEVLLGEVERLAKQTKRWEDMLAILGRLSSPPFQESQRRYAIEKRLEILINEVESPKRAMEEYRRLVHINPQDAEVLSKAEALAQEHELYEELLALYDEVWDATQNLEQRLELCTKRYQLYKETLKSKDDAFNELILSYRLRPMMVLEEQVIKEAELLGRHDVCAALLESEARASMVSDPDALSMVGGIYQDKLSDPTSAAALLVAALSLKPQNTTFLEKVADLSEQTKQRELYAFGVRLSASLAQADSDQDTAISLYQNVADYYAVKLEDKERSIDIQRRILRIDSQNIAALEALIAWHSARSEWSELRSEIKHRIGIGGDDETICEYWLRVASISREYLNDSEGAFEAYAQILSLQENNEEARRGVSELTGSEIGPEVTARRLKLELRLASDEEKPRIMLNLAKLQDEELKQTDAACETLERLYEQTGALGIGFKPLSAIYERQKEWSSLARILKERAEAQEAEGDFEAAGTNLQKALKLADHNLNDDALTESLVCKLHQIHPNNLEIFERYNTILLKNQQWEELSALLGNAKSINDIAPFLKGYDFELARIKALALKNEDEALAIYKSMTRPGKIERNAFFGMASIFWRQGNIDEYIAVMEQVIKQLDPVWGAIFYCHLAEVCDEHDKPNQVANFYRTARGLDANNINASEGLRSIGRRLKNWRQASALLPQENERELSVVERSEKLCVLAKKSATLDESRSWLYKAIAVNHDNIEAWQELAKVEAALGNVREQYESQFGALGAFERTHIPSEENTIAKAYHLQNVALAAKAYGNHERVESLYRQAYAIAPNFAPVAIAVGDLKHEQGDYKAAFKIYNAILNSKDKSLDDNARNEMHLKRGLLANAEKNYELALDDLRQTVKVKPLHIEALLGLAETYTRMKQPLLALYHLQQALIVTPDKTQKRGEILYDMGKLWSDALTDSKEAGIYYEAALDSGATQADLIERCLEIYRQVGRYTEALELVDKLTQSTSDPKVLASLWCTRGELTEKISPDQATEAFDMALSYSPGIAKALDGLERMLAARSEWSQLADLLEGRLEGENDEDAQASILVRLADLYAQKLDMPQKSMQILRRVLEFKPSADVIERLLQATPPQQAAERVELLEMGVSYCEMRYQKAIEIALYHLEQGRKLQAWAILSPLRALLNFDPKLKEILNTLKADYEKPDTVLFEKLKEILPQLSDEQFALFDALHIVQQKLGSFGPKSLDEITTGAAEVTEFTPNGKLFHQMKAILEFENVQLWRSAELPQAIVVIDAQPTIVCIRTEIFQKASGNEIQFWLAKGLMYAHPDYRTLAAAPAAQQERIPEALLAALGIIESTPEMEALVKQFSQNLEDSTIEELRASLTLYDADKLQACAKTLWNDVELVSDLAGALTVAELRTVWRAQSRINESIPEQRSAKSIEDLDALFQNSETLTKVLAFYVSERFGKLVV